MYAVRRCICAHCKFRLTAVVVVVEAEAEAEAEVL